jgi:methylated-DNA-[protein]-cysteine S-methyltransferase
MTGRLASAAPVDPPLRSLRLGSPTGDLVVREYQGAIVALEWLRPRRVSRNDNVPGAKASSSVSPLLVEAGRQLHEYFAGRRQAFDLPLAPAGNPFHQSVWRLMREIPFGRTATYGELARRLDCAAQPVGGACAANPIAILIPCHRVVAASGLGGFSGGEGVESKRFLLRHEGALEAELDLF